jgi:hypothetical protein
MRLIEKILFFLFILALPIRLWGISTGFFIYFIDVFSIFLASYYFFLQSKSEKLDYIQILLILHALWIIIVSILSVIIYNSDIIQIAKGVLQLILYDVFCIFFVKKMQSNIHRNFISKSIFYTGIIIVPLSLINFYTNSFFEIDFIFEFIKKISIGNIELDDNYLKLTFWIRNSSFAGEPNFLGMYFVFLLQIAFLFIRSLFFKHLAAFVLLIAILSTFSRAAIICGVIVYINWAIYFFKKASIWSKLAIWFVIGSSFLFLYSIQLNKVDEIDNAILSISSRDFSSDNQRLNIFNQSLGIFSNYPLGVGPSNYSVYAKNLYGQAGEPNPHNSYLTILVEEGLPGFILLILMLSILLIKLYNNTNIYYVMSFSVFLLALLINDFYKILGYKFFIFYSFFIFINSIKEVKSNNLLKSSIL